MRVSSDGVTIDELVAAAKNAIITTGMSSTDADRDRRVTSIQLTLKVVATIGIGGGMDLRAIYRHATQDRRVGNPT